jgi:hypothetical protein
MAQNAEYSFDELADMILLYEEAERISTFVREKVTATTVSKSQDISLERSRRSADVEDILRAIERSPGTSTRQLGSRHHIYQ